MDRAQKLIFTAGLALILVGFLLGLAINYFTDHRARLVSKDAYEPVFVLISEKGTDVDWHELQKEINASNRFNAHAIGVHTHSINMGILLLLVGLLFPLFHTGQRSDPVLSGIVIAAWTYPIGLMLQMLNFIKLGEIIAALGACLVIGIFVLVFIRVSRALDSIYE